ncbi:MAG: wax ester/triacylglycerol synthase family O-acyltransferase [Acidimicrobiia bacterium]|nr:wax ester/triacylglycerol synthase family O-acyltransferase [Acidimicrobiia bacterium]
MKQLSGHDASFLYNETPNQPMHVGSVMIYDPSTAPNGKVRFKEILAHIENRIHTADLFRKRLESVPMNLDHPWWVDDRNFDVEYHVRHVALPKPGDWRQLCIQAARLHARPLDHTRPLWEFTVVEGLDAVDGLPPGSFAIVSKIHHACVDGVSGDQLNSAIHDIDPAGDENDAPLPWTPEQPPNMGDLLARAWVRNAREPWRFGRLVARTIPAMGRGARATRGLPTPPVSPGGAPRTRFNGTIGPHRVFESVDLELASIKKIREAVPGATVNDVVLTIVGGAMRQYLLDHDGLPNESLTAMAPISARPKGGASNGDGGQGNRVSAMFVSLCTDVAGPRHRLEAVHQSTQASKALTNAVGADLLADYAQFTPSMLAGAGARLSSSLGMANRIDPAYNTVVSNVPGPQEPLYMNGARVVAMHGLAPIHDGVGLFHGVYSYCGRVFVSATACRDMLHDPAAYADALRFSYDELLVAAT